MAVPDPQPGMVLSYSYLWRREYLNGEEEGRKDRPVVVILAVQREEGEFVVTVAPVTTSPSDDDRLRFEIPQATKERLGLDHRSSFIVLTEVNRFAWPGPDIRPVHQDRFHYGYLPAKTFRRLRGRIGELVTERRLAVTPRTT